jgi:hypothetical protein
MAMAGFRESGQADRKHAKEKDARNQDLVLFYFYSTSLYRFYLLLGYTCVTGVESVSYNRALGRGGYFRIKSRGVDADS